VQHAHDAQRANSFKERATASLKELAELPLGGDRWPGFKITTLNQRHNLIDDLSLTEVLLTGRIFDCSAEKPEPELRDWVKSWGRGCAICSWLLNRSEQLFR
jgi:hypothetical protein